MRTPLLVTAAVLALVACTDAEPTAAPPTLRQPAPSAFAAGTCALAAEDVLAVGRDATRLGDGGTVDAAVSSSLRDAQERLAALAETADTTAKAPLDRLVVAIGLVRVRADGNTYETSLGQGLTTAYDAAVGACTSG